MQWVRASYPRAYLQVAKTRPSLASRSTRYSCSERPLATCYTLRSGSPCKGVKRRSTSRLYSGYTTCNNSLLMQRADASESLFLANILVVCGLAPPGARRPLHSTQLAARDHRRLVVVDNPRAGPVFRHSTVHTVVLEREITARSRITDTSASTRSASTEPTI